MLHLFRSFMNSKVGVIVTLAFVVLIAIAFAVGDVTSTGSFGGIGGGERVAAVGDRKITAEELNATIRSEFDNYRQQNPTADDGKRSSPAGAFEDTVKRILDRNALAEFAREHGLRAGSRLVDSQISMIPAFAGPDGKFDQESLSRVDRGARPDRRTGARRFRATAFSSRQVITPVLVPGVLPKPLVKRYARAGRGAPPRRNRPAVERLPTHPRASRPTPSSPPIHKEHRASYMRPERRGDPLRDLRRRRAQDRAGPDRGEIAARYARDRSHYTATETPPPDPAGRPDRSRRQGGHRRSRQGQVARCGRARKGLAVTSVGPVTKEALGIAVVGAGRAVRPSRPRRARLAQPARGGLGLYVMRVDAVEQTPGRTPGPGARRTSSKALAVEKRNARAGRLTAGIEEEIDERREPRRHRQGTTASRSRPRRS